MNPIIGFYINNSYHTLKEKPGEQYPFLYWEDFKQDILNPVSATTTPDSTEEAHHEAKKLQKGMLPSLYVEHDARRFAIQQDKGMFCGLTVDADGCDVTTLATALWNLLGNSTFAVFPSYSDGLKEPRSRAVIPLHPNIRSGFIPGRFYKYIAGALASRLRDIGIPADSVVQRQGQIAYYGTKGPASTCSPIINEGEWFNLTSPFGAELRDLALTLESSEYKSSEKTGTSEGKKYGTAVWVFNLAHDTEELLSLFQFTQGYDGKWKFPEQTNKGTLEVYPDGGWSSFSQTGRAGRQNVKGHRYGDAFDLFKTYVFLGEDEPALQVATSLMYGYNMPPREYWRPEYSQHVLTESRANLAYFVSHGRQVYEALLREQQAEGLARAEEVQIALAAEVGNNDDWDLDWPPGLVGELAKWIYLSSSRQIKQYAIAAAFYFFSAAGRKYNVNGKGLNIFMMLVGKTGRGKGVVKDAIDTVVAEIVDSAQNPGLAAPFNYEIAVSESGIRKALMKQNPICVYEEELGLTILPLTAKKCSTNDMGLRKILTRLFDSGARKKLGIREASDKDRVRELVHMPCFTLAGDTQPEVFRALLGNGTMDSGFAPRMVPFFYLGDRKYHNKDSVSHKIPPGPLVARLRQLLEYVSSGNETIVDIRWASGVEEEYDLIDVECTDRINAGEAGGEMLNRFGAIVARLAGLLAIGKDHLNPVIDHECLTAAKEIAGVGLRASQEIIASGGAGSGESVRMFRLREALEDFVSGNVNPDTKIRTYKTPKSIVENKSVINENYLMIRLKHLQDFAGEGNKTTEMNIRDTIAEAVRQGMLEQTQVVNLDKRCSQTMYILGGEF